MSAAQNQQEIDQQYEEELKAKREALVKEILAKWKRIGYRSSASDVLKVLGLGGIANPKSESEEIFSHPAFAKIGQASANDAEDNFKAKVDQELLAVLRERFGGVNDDSPVTIEGEIIPVNEVVRRAKKSDD